MGYKVMARIQGIEEPAEVVAKGFKLRRDAVVFAQDQQATNAPDPEDGDIVYFVQKEA